ncbi:hypothetical protein [Streptomyces sp. NPDC002580]|uniref:hypothetical protein n=1 Tax=Streptomyces sp. NPDC002580 TaxID=3364653 RepID=UPI0036BD5AE7
MRRGPADRRADRATLGIRLALSGSVLEAAAAAARRVPADPAARGPDLAFGPTLDVPSGSDPLSEALRLLGRDPDAWPSARR